MKKPLSGLFLLQIEVEVVQLFLQASFLEQVVDDPALGQIGLGDLDRGFAALVVIFGDEIVFDLDIFFLGHLFTPRLRGALGAPYSGKFGAGKKVFFNRYASFSLAHSIVRSLVPVFAEILDPTAAA